MRVLAGALAEDPDRRPPAARALAAELRDLAPRLAVESPVPVPTAPLSAANTVTMAQARSSAGAHQRPLSAWRLAALPVAVALLLGVPARLGREAERPVAGGVPLAAVGSAGLSPSTASRSNARSESGEPPPHVAAHPIRVRPVALQDIPSPPPSTDAADEVRRPPAEAAAEPRSGRLQIGARPWAHVLLDGVDVGSTPLALAVPAGTHRIRLVHPAYRPYARTLRLAPGETRRLYVDLRLDGVPRRPPPVE
jgi:hypothetical protein